MEKEKLERIERGNKYYKEFKNKLDTLREYRFLIC